MSVRLSGISFSKMKKCVLFKKRFSAEAFLPPSQILPRPPAMTGPGEMVVGRAGLVQPSEASGLCGSQTWKMIQERLREVMITPVEHGEYGRVHHRQGRDLLSCVLVRSNCWLMGYSC